jgi:hypothetical protein
MIVRTSQNLRPPERKPTPFGRQLQEALERAQAQRSQDRRE